MFDFKQLKKYRENNRIEAKKALGGLPKSLWETYSAFANAIGGLILLGVEEYPDKSLHAVDLPSPEKLVAEFWDIVSDKRFVSANILGKKDVKIETVEGKHIILISVPRAQRIFRPVYLGEDPYMGTYRRDGEGDRRCKREEVESMLRDADEHTPDEKLLTHLSMDALDQRVLKTYLSHFQRKENLLFEVGAAGKDPSGIPHPTAAGFLMFGKNVASEFPNLSFVYRGEKEISAENLFAFYRKIRNCFLFEFPPKAQSALSEALLNGIVNADYFGEGGILIEKSEECIKFSNPGLFRMDPKRAKSGGVSDPRNASLVKIFFSMEIGKRAGSGIPRMFSSWREMGLPFPYFTESFNPERTTLVLPLKTSATKNRNYSVKSEVQKAEIIRYLTENVKADSREVSSLLETQLPRARKLLSELERDSLVVHDGTRPKIYRLKD